MTERTRRGSFLLPDGTKSTLVDVHITEIVRGPDEPGIGEYTGWASVPPEFAGPLGKHWVETQGAAELVLDNGSSVPISILGMSTNETGRAIVRFGRRAD